MLLAGPFLGQLHILYCVQDLCEVEDSKQWVEYCEKRLSHYLAFLESFTNRVYGFRVCG